MEGHPLKLLEALTQVFVGTLLIWISNSLFFLISNIEITSTQNTTLVFINTLLAFAKTYTVRELFHRVLK